MKYVCRLSQKKELMRAMRSVADEGSENASMGQHLRSVSCASRQIKVSRKCHSEGG
jgi:hypothetical protein